jgi:hypothetical protein
LKMTANERKTLLWFLVLLFGALLVASPFVYSTRRMAAIEAKARTLRVGDSREKVVELLGKPNFETGDLIPDNWGTDRVLIYAKSFRLWQRHDGLLTYKCLSQYAEHRPQEGDVVVFLNAYGRVERIHRLVSPSSTGSTISVIVGVGSEK